MSLEGELRLFLRRTARGVYRLEGEDGSLVIQGPSYRALRQDLENIVRTMMRPRRDVKILIGQPARSPSMARPESGSFPPLSPAS